ncbi:MAG: SAM-dependent methyltransferase [Clostridia bacterium]|nr:SAM-dependent methyltransferase [Clostridia bacterium]
MRIPITERLKTAAEMIGQATVLCDIGCDHGYLPIYLAEKGQIQRAYACDLRDGPLKTAANNITAYHLKDRIQTVKSDGLHELSEFSFDVISICGMGGRLIAEIIERDLDIAGRAKKLVLQPMSEIPVLRKFLSENGFLITEERLALEDRRFYVLMTVEKGEEIYRDELDYVIGRRLFMHPDALTRDYLSKEIRRFSEILTARGGRDKAPEIDRILEELKKIEENRI